MVDFPHKIVVPRQPHLVPRQRLRKLLHDMVGRQLTILTAPAGYGKTSLLIDFATRRPPLPICWYSLDALDRDPWVFLHYLSTALAQRFPEQITPVRPLPGEAAFPAAIAVMRDIARLSQPLLLILDNWQMVDGSAPVGELVGQLLAHCPNCRVLLSSRYYPALPDLMLWAARQQVSELSEEHLRFSAREAAAVFKAKLPSVPPIEQIEQMIERTNGWITGTLLMFQDGLPTSPAEPLAPHTESRLYRFLAEQVLGQQTPALQRFMLDSALLDEMTAERCDTLFGTHNAAQVLQTLLRQRLFVVESRPSLRYQPLFRAFLLAYHRHTDPQGFYTNSMHVAVAYITQGQWAPAFEVCITVGNLEAARGIVQAGGERLFWGGQLDMLERWFEQLPNEQLDGALLWLKAQLLISRGRYAEAQVLADMAAARQDHVAVLRVQALRTQLAVLSGHYREALMSAQQIYESSTEPPQQAAVLRWLGICQQRLGNTQAAIGLLRQSLAIEQQRDNLPVVALLQHELGRCHLCSGLLREAEEYFANAEAYWSVAGNAGRSVLSLLGRVAVMRLTGRHQKAYRALHEAQRLVAEAGVPEYQALLHAGFGDFYNDLQLWQLASAAYDEAQIDGASAYTRSSIELSMAQQLVRQQQFAAAQRMLQQRAPLSTQHPSLCWLLHAQVLFGLGQVAEAAQQVQSLIAHPEAAGTPLILARCHILQARIIAATTPDDHAALVGALDQACRIADRLGHDNFLLIETLDLADLIQQAADAGWVRATDWLERHQQLHQFASDLLDGQRLRVVAQAFGDGRLTLNERPIEVNWTKAREVLYYLLTFPEGGTSGAISEAIWPELGPDRGRNTLKSAVYELRSTFSHAMIDLHRRRIYQINRDTVRLDYDVERFNTLLDTQRDDRAALLAAIELYRGPYLPWSDNAWSAQMRARLEQRYLQALHLVAVSYEQSEQHADALLVYQKVLAIDGLDEAAHTGVMRCYERQGNRNGVIAQYRLLRRTLYEELGIELERTAEAELIYQRTLQAP